MREIQSHNPPIEYAPVDVINYSIIRIHILFKLIFKNFTFTI